MLSTLIFSAALLTAAPKNADAPATEEPAAEEKAPKADVPATELNKPTEETTDPTKPEKQAPAVEKPAVAVGPAAAPKADKGPKIFYVVQHVAMGAGVAFVVVQLLAVVITGPVVWLLPFTGTPETLFPKDWRTALMVGLLAGVAPGLLIMAVGATVATVVSAVRNVGVMTGEN